MLALDLPPPSNWQDFESLCCDLWRLIWGDPEAQKNGRSGQPQAGVDVFGRPGGGAQWAGVQCKQKGRGERLTCSEITNEALTAERFEPPLTSFIVATTALRDIEAQRAARELNDHPAIPFTVAVFAWDDIVGELQKHPDLLRRYYPAALTSDVRVSIERLPVTGELLVGRDDEFRRLDAAWDDSQVHVLSLVAWGGVGKTALVKHWLGQMAADEWRGAERVFGWSFYSQGTEERLASADQFIDEALRFFGDPDPTAGSPRDRGLRLAELARRGRTLLVLDGIEPLQHPPNFVHPGRLKEPALAVLIKSLAASGDGLCLITTREAIADVMDLAASTAPRLALEQLTPESGAELLRHLGVKGTDCELREAAEDFGGHALALTLLGTYLRKACGGDIRRRSGVPLGRADERQGGHAYRVMAAYERWLGPGPELAILRLLGLFDRPAEGEPIAALRATPVIPELNESLVGIVEDDWQWALTNLRDCGLLAAPDASAPTNLDTHPLVRSYFGDQLQERHPEVWRAGHERLYEHFSQAAPELPDTLEEMMPLYAAVFHGCRAGKHDEVFKGIYWLRIARESEYYQIRKLGAFGADLVVLSGFFTRPWDEPEASLSDDDKAVVLAITGFELRALGRLTEAAQQMHAALKLGTARKDWKNAAVQAGNLSELHLTLGDVPQAVASAEESVELADRSGDVNQRMSKRTTLADALHHAGRLGESAAAFREAEVMQAERQPQYPRLYSVYGYRYCDLLLSRGRPEGGSLCPHVRSARSSLAKSPLDLPFLIGGKQEGVKRYQAACEEVHERATYAIEIAERINWPADIALDHLALGRAHFGLALAAAATGETVDFAAPAEHLNRAVDGLRQSGREDILPAGLLARAALRRVRGNRPGASADLSEALEIAERGTMRLHQCDAHLEWTRFHLAAGEAEDARRHLEIARELVEETGYRRREGEVAFLEERLTASGS